MVKSIAAHELINLRNPIPGIYAFFYLNGHHLYSMGQFSFIFMRVNIHMHAMNFEEVHINLIFRILGYSTASFM